MAYLRRKNTKKWIFVLLGASGSGKTTYGQTQVKHAPKNKVMFLSTGLQLRNQNHLSTWSEPDMPKIKEFCYELINETLHNFKASKKHMLLILDCVKDLEDAEHIAAQAFKHDLQVTRALLFDISPNNLHENWIQRQEDRDTFRGATHVYLNSWKKKSNDLVNYYKELNLLCTINAVEHYDEEISLLDSDINKDYPVSACPNNVRFLLLNSTTIKTVLAQLQSILKINNFQFSLPASFVHCYRDVMWVTDPSRYHVTAKIDGVRCLLLKIRSGAYFITRKNEIYSCRLVDDKLPCNTVLDGELLPSKSIQEIHPMYNTSLKSSVFLVFDVLAVSDNAYWMWPFSLRHERLSKLPISTDITTVMRQASGNDELLANKIFQSVSLNKPKELAVYCAVKEHKSSTPNEVCEFLCPLPQLPYPCDGLVFTPNTAYVFGPDPLLFKWQSEDSVHCEILLRHLKSGKRKCVYSDLSQKKTPHYLQPKRKGAKTSRLLWKLRWNVLNEGEIIECKWDQTEQAWDPLFVRQDKTFPNSDETIDHVEKLCEQQYSRDDFIMDVVSVEHPKNTANKATFMAHPSTCHSFDELYAKITELVQLGYVEKTIDSETNLVILNYTTCVKDPLISMCRGLVLHLDSKTIVTKPFVRFFEDVAEHDSEEMVETSIKFDGSLGIAFLWKDEVMVTTRRRMDSEQAIWAKQWIKDHCCLNSFQAGCTYLFEIIYQENTVVVNYMFEGLVLLAITNENGHELPYDEVLQCGRTIGFFMVTPRITAPYSEILWYCGGIALTKHKSSPNPRRLYKPPPMSGALPINKNQQEGWVVKFEDGERQKIVYTWWKNASKIVHLVHPQIVWLLVKHDKIKEILRVVPHHFLVEIHSMLRALGREFTETIKNAQDLPAVSSLKRHVSTKSRNKVCDVLRSFVSADSQELEETGEALGKFSEQVDKTRVQESGVINIVTMEDFIKFVRKIKPLKHIAEISNSLETTVERHRSVNVSPFYSQQKLNYLRLVGLQYICPKSPALEGYKPSANFKQTWCKGWKTLPINHGRFIQEVLQRNHTLPPFLRLPVEMIVFLFKFVDGKSLAAMTKVCMTLRHIVMSSPAFKEKIVMAKKEDILRMVKEKERERKLLEYEFSCLRYSRYSEPSYNYWSGYGSHGSY